jgi:hypothetical protein
VLSCRTALFAGHIQQGCHRRIGLAEAYVGVDIAGVLLTWSKHGLIQEISEGKPEGKYIHIQTDTTQT